MNYLDCQGVGVLLRMCLTKDGHVSNGRCPLACNKYYRW